MVFRQIELPGTRAAVEVQRAAAVAVALEAYERAARASRGVLAESTLAQYRAAWLAWSRWAVRSGVQAFPAHPSNVRAYLELRHELRPGTLRSHLAGVRFVHEWCSEPFLVTRATRGPILARVRAGHDRERRRARALEPALVLELLERAGGSAGSARDRRSAAAVGLAWTLGLRGSEVLALEAGSITEAPQGIQVELAGGKTRRKLEVRTVRHTHAVLGERRCVACLVLRVIRERDQAGTPRVFALSRWWLSRELRRLLEACGREAEGFSSHSMRRGVATAAALEGRSPYEVSRILGHSSLETALGYVAGAAWSEDPGAELLEAAAAAREAAAAAGKASR